MTLKSNARKASEDTGERSTKRPRLTEVLQYASIPELQAALSANNKKPTPELVKSLTTLRNQISLRHSELQAHIRDPRTKLVAPNDERIRIVEEWCKVSPGLPELFEIWDTSFDESAGHANGSQGLAIANSVVSLVLSSLNSILTLLATSYAFQGYGLQIVNRFTPQHFRQLNTYISGGQARGRSAQGTNNEMILVALRLLSVISEKWDSKRVFESFGWEAKALPKLLTMRRKTEATADLMVKPDIRTAYIIFLVSFFSVTGDNRANSQTKTTFLSTPSSASAFLSTFKSLHSDHPAVIKRVLEVCWEGIWCDIRISRSLKVGVFGDLHGVLGNLLKLYETPDTVNFEHSAADLVHHFLLAICTRPGVGLCFKDRGWYPREGDDDSANAMVETKSKGFERGKMYNIILSQFLRMLKVTDDPRQQELALKILKACPELPAGYLPASGLTLDPPRLSSKWLANIAFVTGVITLAVPVDSFQLATSQPAAGNDTPLYNPVPPSLNTILGNIIPGSQNLSMKNVFTKGLQWTPATSNKTKTTTPAVGNLVQHTTALALIKCLDKLARVKQSFQDISAALGEGETEAQWNRRLKEVMREVRRRLPEFQVVVAFCSAHLRALITEGSIQEGAPTNPTDSQSSASLVKKRALLAECAMRLLWMYQKCVPEVVEGGRFDVGKILVGFEFSGGEDADDTVSDEESDEDKGAGESGDEDRMDEDKGQEEDGDQEAQIREAEDISVARRLHRVTQLHILRFLKESNTFVGSGGWTGKSQMAASTIGGGNTHLHTLLSQFIKFHPSTATGNYELSIHTQIASLVQHILGSTLLFQDDPEEVELWLNSLPFGVRRVRVVTRSKRKDKGAEDSGEGDWEDEMETLTLYPETPDGTTLIDERESVISFLDECVQRCLKAPHKYIEEIASFVSPGTSAQDVDAMDVDTPSSDTPPRSTPSALLATVVEQLTAKVRGKLLVPSDVLAIATFLRKLMFALLGKTDISTSNSGNLAVLAAVAKKIADGLEVEKMLFADEAEGHQHAIIKRTIRREVEAILVSLGSKFSYALNDDGSIPTTLEVSDEEAQDVDEFLDLIDGLDLPPSKRERRLTAFELIDWLRLLQTSLSLEQTTLIFNVVKRLGGQWAVRELAGCIAVDSYSLWEVLNLGNDAEAWEGIPFEYLMLHARLFDLASNQGTLVDSATHYSSISFLHSTSSPELNATYSARIIRVILQHLVFWRQKGTIEASNALLVLVGQFLEVLKVAPPFEAVKELVFNGGFPELKEVFLSTSAFSLTEAIARIQTSCLDYKSPKDRQLVQDIANFWCDRFLAFLSKVNKGKSESDATRGQVDYALTWIKYLDPSSLLDCIESALAIAPSSDPNLLHLLQIATDPLQAIATGHGAPGFQVGLLGSRLSLLFKLHGMLSDPEMTKDFTLGNALEELIAVALEATLPMGLAETLYSTSSESRQPLIELLKIAKFRWSQSRSPRKEDMTSGETTWTRPTIPTLLKQSSFTDVTGRIVGNLLYREQIVGPTDRPTEDAILEWLDSDACPKHSLNESLPILHSILDFALHSSTPSTLPVLFANEKRLSKLLQRLFKVFTTPAYSPTTRRQAKPLFTMLLEVSRRGENSAKGRPDYCLGRLRKSLGGTSFIAPEWVWTARWIQLNFSPTSSCRLLINEVIENTLQYLIRQLGGQDSGSISIELGGLIREFTILLDPSKNAECDSTSVEALLPLIVEHHLAQPAYLALVETILRVSSLKPLVVNRYLQAIVQHPRFYRLFSSSIPPSEALPIQNAITSLLHTMFHLHPSNTCQVSHVEPLVRIYRGTLSKADLRILDVLRLFEGQRKLSVSALLAKWTNAQSSSAIYIPSLTSLQALQSLDASLVLRTALTFPFWRTVEDRPLEPMGDGHLYDPVFLMLLFGNMLSENPPEGSIAWIELLRSNVVGVFVRALSSSHTVMRKMALPLLTGVWRSVQDSELQEKGHMIYILNQIKNLLPPPPSSFSDKIYPARLPSYISLLFFHCLRGVFNPSHFMYPLTSRFLLQRPELDTTDVPLLYSLLYSSSDDHWRKERGWILRFLADGMLATGSGTQDWKILKRRHTWDLLASMYQSAHSEEAIDEDKGLRQAILCVLVNLTRHRRPCLGLVLKNGLLSWMEMQLKREITAGSRRKGVAWIKIIENIVLVLDKSKMKGSPLEGEWQATLWRCITALLTIRDSAALILRYATRVMAWLSNCSETVYPAFTGAMSLAVQRLQDFEVGITQPDSASDHAPWPDLDELVPPALHGSHGLHEQLTIDDPFAMWGRLVEMLWRVAMKSHGQEADLGPVWDKLTSRLLVWRSIVGPENSLEGEWARVQALRCLS